MTSTNDGKDVKSNHIGGPKAKTYYIELYKTLEAQLSAESELDSRTNSLCEAWRRVHCLCVHSAPSTHPHLISWLQRHTAQTLLQSEWQKLLDKQKQLIHAIDFFIAECHSANEGRASRPQWETILLKRAEWFKSVIPDPWGNPVLKALLGLSDPTSEDGEGPTDDQVLQWLKEERAVFFVTRLRQLGTSKGTELGKLALKLASAVMDRVRACRDPVCDTDQQPVTIDVEEERPPTFQCILSKEAGFTIEIWELITDIEFVLQYKDRTKCIALAKQTPLHMGCQLMERLNSRLEISPREKRLWKNSKDVAILIAQVMMARCMVVPSCCGVTRNTLTACSSFLVRELPDERLPASMAALAAPAASSRHLHALAVGVHTQCKDERKPFVCELYIRAITAGMNELERLKVNKDKDTEARAAEKLLSTWFIQLGSLLGQSARLAYECALTSFSLHPSRVMYERISAAPELPHQPLASHPHHPANKDAQEPTIETNSEFGSWATDSRSQTNLVKTSQTLNLKKTQQQSNVLSTAVLNEGEALGLSPELCQDLIVLLSGPRVKTLSWDMDKTILIENCRSYMERTHGGTKALTTELKYLNLDPGSFQHLPEEEDEDESDIYYGIEKGYEHLVEVPGPDDIWKDALSDPEKTESCYSNEDETFVSVPRRKKKPLRRLSDTTDEEELDPLCNFVTKSRSRPHSNENRKEKSEHSKDRSKDAKKNETQGEKKHKKERSTSRSKKKEKRKDKKRLEQLETDPLRIDNDPLNVDVPQYPAVNELTPQSLVSEENKILLLTGEEKSKAKPKKERKKREKKEKKEKIQRKKGTMSGALRRLIGQKIIRTNPNTQEHIRREETETDFNNQMFITDSDYDSQGKSSVASGNDPDVLFDGLYSMDEIKSPERVITSKTDVPNRRNIPKQLNTPIGLKITNARIMPDCLKVGQQVGPVTTIATVTASNPPPLIYNKSEPNDDVKVNIKRLLEFRKQKSSTDLLNGRRRYVQPGQYIQNSSAYKTIPNKILTSNTVEQDSGIQSGCQKALSIPNIPKIFINKQQIDQINVLKNEVDSYYSNRNNSANNLKTNSIKSQPVRPEMRLNNQQSNPEWNKSIKPANENKMDQKVFNSLHQSCPVKDVENPKLVSQSNVKMNQNISKQNFPKQNIPQQNVAGGKQSKSNNLHDFLKDLHRSINAGVSNDNLRIIAPTSDNNVSYPINYSAKQTKPQKKSDNAPNTFARLNYMHKNRQGEATINNELKTQNKFHRPSHSQLIDEKKVLNYQHDTMLPNCDTTIVRKIEKTAQKNINSLSDQHSTIHQTVIKPSNEKRSNLTPANPANAAPRTTMLTDDDQNQLLLLLRQQGKLNVSKAPTKHEVIITKGQNNKLTPNHSLSMSTALNLQNHPHGNMENIRNQTQVRQELSRVPTQSCQNVSHSTENTAKFQPRSSIIKKPEKSKNSSTQHKIITGNNKDFKNNGGKSEPQDWESVMDALLAQKTPSRGSNALNMQKPVQDKSNNFQEQLLKNIDSNIQINRSVISKNINTSINNRQINNTKDVNLIQSKLKDNVAIPILSNIDDVPSLVSIQPTTSYITPPINRQAPLQMADNAVRKNTPTVVIRRVSKAPPLLEPFQKGVNCDVPVDVDPLLSDILPSADYDLLEELMDDDLRQEIGELLSDEDAFSVPNDIAKANKVKSDIIKPTIDESSRNLNVRHNRLPTKQAIPISQSVMKVPEPQVAQVPTSFENATIIMNNVHKTSYIDDQKMGHASTATQQTIVSNVNHATTPHPVIVTTNAQSNPMQQYIRNNVIDDQSRYITLNSTMASNILHTPTYVQQNIVKCGNQDIINNLRPTVTASQTTGSVFTTVTHQPIQKVVLIRPEIIYDQYSPVEVHQSANPTCNFNPSTFVAVPNISIYGAQFATPVIRPLIISTPVTMPNNENVTPAVNTSNLSNCNNFASKVAPQQLIFPTNTLESERSSSTECSHKNNLNPSTLQETITATKTAQPHSFDEQRIASSDLVNSNFETDKIKTNVCPGNDSERKVLSEVQEKEPHNINVKPPLIDHEVKKDIHKAQEERIKRKKLTLLNRPIHIVSHSEPIPLPYAALAKVKHNKHKRLRNPVTAKKSEKQTVIALGYKPISKDKNTSDFVSKNNDTVTTDLKGNCATKMHKTEPKCETNGRSTITLRSSKQPSKQISSDTERLVDVQKEGGARKNQPLDSSKVNDRRIASFAHNISDKVNCIPLGNQTSIGGHSNVIDRACPPLLTTFPKDRDTTRTSERNHVTLRSLNKPVNESVSAPQTEKTEKNISSLQKECGSKENDIEKGNPIKQLNKQTSDKIASSENKKPNKRIDKTKANINIPDQANEETGNGLVKQKLQEKQKNDEAIKDTEPQDINGIQCLLEKKTPVSKENFDMEGQLADAIRAKTDPKTRDETKTAENQIDINNHNKQSNIKNKDTKRLARSVTTRYSLLNKNTVNGEIDSIVVKDAAAKDITKIVSNKVEALENQTETNTNELDKLEVTKPRADELRNQDSTNNTNGKALYEDKSVKCDKLTSFNNDCENVSKTDEIKDTKQSTNDRVTPHIKDISKTSRKNRRKMEEEKSREDKLMKDLKDIITIKELPRKETDDPFKRCISIKISNGNSFKATVSGKLQVDIDSLFKDPGLRSVLLNNLPSNASCFINVQQFGSAICGDNIRTQIIYPQSKNIETVNLISDDEEEETKKPQIFRTEFGTFNTQPVNADILSKHQDKFSQKCSVLINRCKIPVSTTQSESEKDGVGDKSISSKHECTKIKLLPEIILPPPSVVNNGTNKDIIEIDDSSNDSFDIRNKIFDVTQLKLPHRIQMDIKQLKETLLQDFCVDIGDKDESKVKEEFSDIGGKLKDGISKNLNYSENQAGDAVSTNDKPTIKSARNGKRGIKCKRSMSSKNKHPAPKKIRRNKDKCDELVKRYQLLNITKKCYVSLERCDKLLQTITEKHKSFTVIETVENIAPYEFQQNVENESNNLRRSGSISILNEFEHIDKTDWVNMRVRKNYEDFRICRSDWYMSKLELHYLNRQTQAIQCRAADDDLSTDCESDLDNSVAEAFLNESVNSSVSNIFQVPSLFKLSFKSVETSYILKCLEYQEIKTCNISKPDLKRKSSTPEDTVNTKILKLDVLTKSPENVLRDVGVEKGSETEYNLPDELQIEILSEEIFSKVEEGQTCLDNKLNKDHLAEVQKDIHAETVSEQQRNLDDQALETDIASCSVQEDAKLDQEPENENNLTPLQAENEARKLSESRNDEQDIQTEGITKQVNLDTEKNEANISILKEIHSVPDEESDQQSNPSNIVTETVLDDEVTENDVNTKETDFGAQTESEFKNSSLVIQDVRSGTLSDQVQTGEKLNETSVNTIVTENSGEEKSLEIKNNVIVSQNIQKVTVSENTHLDDWVNETDISSIKEVDSETDKRSEIKNDLFVVQPDIQSEMVVEQVHLDTEINETYVVPINEIDSVAAKRSEFKNDLFIEQHHIENEIVAADQMQIDEKVNEIDVNTLKETDSITDVPCEIKNDQLLVQDIQSEYVAEQVQIDNELNEIVNTKEELVKEVFKEQQNIQNEIVAEEMHLDNEGNKTDVNTSKEVYYGEDMKLDIKNNSLVVQADKETKNDLFVFQDNLNKIVSDANVNDVVHGIDTAQEIQGEVVSEVGTKEVNAGAAKVLGSEKILCDAKQDIQSEVFSEQLHLDGELIGNNNTELKEVNMVDKKSEVTNCLSNVQQDTKRETVSNMLQSDDLVLETKDEMIEVNTAGTKELESENDLCEIRSEIFSQEMKIDLHDAEKDIHSDTDLKSQLHVFTKIEIDTLKEVTLADLAESDVINESIACIRSQKGIEQLPKVVDIQKADEQTSNIAVLETEEATGAKNTYFVDEEDTLKSDISSEQMHLEKKVTINKLEDEDIQDCLINDTQDIHAENVDVTLCSEAGVQEIELEKIKELDEEEQIKIEENFEKKDEIIKEPIFKQTCSLDEQFLDEKCQAKASISSIIMETEIVVKSAADEEVSNIKQAETLHSPIKYNSEKQNSIVNSHETGLDSNNIVTHSNNKSLDSDGSTDDIDNGYLGENNFAKIITDFDKVPLDEKKTCSINKDVVVNVNESCTQVTDDESNDNHTYGTENKSNGTPKNITLLYEGESKVVLKGSIIEDAIVGTCYVFPIIDPQVLNSVMSNIDHSQNDAIKNICLETEQAEKSTKLSEDVDLNIIKPEVTYSRTNFMTTRRCLKRKIESIDSKIQQKKYRKGKNIDYPKITVAAMCDFAYSKEFKRLSNYCSSIKFSYTKDYHLTCYGDVHTMLENWPIKEIQTPSAKILDTDCNLFIDKELRISSDPTRKTLAEELSAHYDDKVTSSEEIKETNFSMGFGEGSGRVNQNLKDRRKINNFTAATLSDVKQFQPLLSENRTQETLATRRDQLQKIDKFYSYVKLRDKVRMFFKETTAKLNFSLMHNNSKRGKDKLNTNSLFSILDDFVFDVEFFQPPINETVVQVVQVGQLPVSAAAQNPVTCDPRVTQVTDASLPQCSMEDGSSEDMEIKTEYTELTTAEISLPLSLPEYEHHQTLISASQVSNIPNGNDNITIETEVKIEVLDEEPENVDENSCYDTKDFDTFTSDQINNSEYPSFDANEMDVQIKTEPDLKIVLEPTDNNLDEEQMTELYQHQPTGSLEKQDQLAHAMNAAGITNSPEPDSEPTPEAIDLSNTVSHNICEVTDDNQFQESSMTTMTLQQALSKILPQHLNTANEPENNSHASGAASQFLHIVHGKNPTVNQATPAESPQEPANTPPAPIFHIVQSKSSPTGSTSNDSAGNSNSYNNLSLVDTGLSPAGNQLLHIVNAAAHKSNNATQLLKRVNLLTNLTNAQGSNEQKMVQFVCKSADAKGIQLNAQQRGMVLRLHPIEGSATAPTSSKPESQELENEKSSDLVEDSPQVELKSRSIYEENYAKFIQESNKQAAESAAAANAILESTMLPKFHQVFGKSIYAENNPNTNIVNQSNGHFENSQRMGNPLLLRKPACPTSQAPQNVQQVKQTITPMNIQTMHGGVIYTRQIPVNIGGGQTINLITVPSTERVDETVQKQKPDEKFATRGEAEQSFIKIVPQTPGTPNTEVTTEESNNSSGVSNENSQNPQPPPMLTQMRIKLPMLSKNTQMVSGTRVVRPSFFQIQRNVIGGANQPVYQQLVLTAAPTLGAHSIRLPQVQTNREMKVAPENQTSSESEMSSSNLELREQLREFDMVLEQVKERSEVQPNGTPVHEYNAPPVDTSDASEPATSTTSSETTQQILYSVGNNQQLNVAYVNRKQTVVSTPASTSFARSPDSSGIVDSPPSSSHAPPTPRPLPPETPNETSPSQIHNKPSKSSSKSKSRPKPHHTPFKFNHVPPKPSNQKPMEDEQTTQRILYILAEYKEQVENSPDKDKPAPRRRTNLTAGGIVAAPPTGGSKRKKSSSGSRRNGRDSPIDDNCRTMGSEDSSCGTSQGDCNESCLETHSPQDSPRKVAKKLNYDQEPVPQTRPQPPRNVLVTDGPTIAVTRAAPGKPATAVLMPANYILPVSMVKSGQQIAIVTNRGPKILTVGGGEGGATNALLLQRLIGPAGLKPMLARPGVRHVRLPTAALQNLQAFNLNLAANAPPPTPSETPAPMPSPPQLIPTNSKAPQSPWPAPEQEEVKPERESSPEETEQEPEPWNAPQDYSYEETVRTEMDRTVLDPIPDRYSPDMEAERMFDKMFDVESKKDYIVESQDDSPHCPYDIDTSDCDDKAFHQVVQRRDGITNRHRLVSAATLRQKFALMEDELRLQKSLSEECADLGVDSPSASDLFPEAELLFSSSPAHEVSTSHQPHTPQPVILSQSSNISPPEIEDHSATDHLISPPECHAPPPPEPRSEAIGLGLEDVGIVTVSEDGMRATISLDHEEFVRSHPNTTFHRETDDGEIQPVTIDDLKARHLTSTLFQADGAPATVLVTAPQTTVISQATPDGAGVDHLRCSHADSLHTIRTVPDNSDHPLRLHSILDEPPALSNTTHVIRRLRPDRDSRYDDPEGLAKTPDSRGMDSSGDGDRSSPERNAELFWEMHSRSLERRLDFSSDSDKCRSPSDENNSTDSSGIGSHVRLDSVIKNARGIDVDDGNVPPLRTYPPKRTYHHEHRKDDRYHDESRRRASNRGVVKRGCHCCNGSPAPKPKKSRPRKPNLDFN